MRTVIQRVSRASVTVGDGIVSAIDRGLVALVAVVREDADGDVAWTARKLATLRAFPSAAGAYDLDVQQANGAVLLVSNFTVAADVAGGRRPSLSAAMTPGEAVVVFDRLVAATRALGVRVETGAFGADMLVELVNDGPLTLIADSRRGGS